MYGPSAVNPVEFLMIRDFVASRSGGFDSEGVRRIAHFERIDSVNVGI
jgi:hypothetical protein